MGQRGRVYYFQKAPVAADLALGKVHAIDVMYVFNSFGSLGIIPSPADRLVEKTVQQAWSSFARTGRPDFPIPWPFYDPAAPSVVSIDASPSLVAGYRGGRCDKLRALGLVP